MKNKLFTGIMPALITPIDAESNLKEAALRRIINWELGKGVDGFYINGATGEGLFLPEAVRVRLAEIAMEECAGKAAVINHIGAVDTQSAIRLARHAGKLGCSAVSSLVPNYLTMYTNEQVLDYYKRVSDAAGLPVLVYCKGAVGGDPFEFMKRVMTVDGVIGCKYTMFDYYSMHRICELNGGDINVINGPDEMLVCGLTMGADGGIGSTYNLMGDWYKQLHTSFRAGDFEEARRMQFRINKVIEVILAHGCIESIKQAFNIMGFDVGNVAYPGKVFTADEERRFIAEMNAAGYKL